MSDEVNFVTRNYEILLYLRSLPIRPAAFPATPPAILPAHEPPVMAVLLIERL